jgi:hypothetical protein
MKILTARIWQAWLAWVFRKQRVIVITGLRRSGNHACIEWICNALEDRAVEFSPIGRSVFLSKTARTLHFNEVNWDGPLEFARRLRLHKAAIRESGFVIISLEDYLIEPSSPYVPKRATLVLINRTLENVIASRLTYATKQAALGLDRGDMRVDEHLMETAQWLEQTEGPNILRWDYDLWFLNEGSYRRDFLASLGLATDISQRFRDMEAALRSVTRAWVLDRMIRSTEQKGSSGRIESRRC